MEFYKGNFFFKRFEEILEQKKKKEEERKKSIKKKKNEKKFCKFKLRSNKNKDSKVSFIINIKELIEKKKITQK